MRKKIFTGVIFPSDEWNSLGRLLSVFSLIECIDKGISLTECTLVEGYSLNKWTPDQGISLTECTLVEGYSLTKSTAFKCYSLDESSL